MLYHIEKYVDELASSSFSRLILQLNKYGSFVSVLNQEALKRLMKLYAYGLSGKLDSKYYLFSLDPGSGKTESISSFIKEWRLNDFLPGGSILIAVNTKDQIKGIVERLDLDDADFACFTSDNQYDSYGIGVGRRADARVLITTHQMIAARCKDRTFSAAKDFYYKDSPRSLRIWDESFLQSQQITIKVNKIHALVDDLGRYHRGFANELADFASTLAVAATGHRIDISPELKSYVDMLNADARSEPAGAAANVKKKHGKTLEAFTKGADGQLRLGKYGGLSSLVLIGCSKPMPADFASAIILDASGRVRGTYRLMEEAGVQIERLPSEPNGYGNLQLRFWQTACGKDALRDGTKNRTVIGEIAKVIQEKPEEQWLVIGSKQSDDGNIDIEGWLRDTLPDAINERGNVHFLHWGLHTATNNFKDIRNVVVVGTHDYGNAGYHALAAAASGSCPDQPTKAAAISLFRDEYAHNLLQGLMRSNARNARNGECGECTAYVIASSKVDEELLQRIFPKSQINIWRKDAKSLKGQSKILVDYLSSRLNGSEPCVVKKVNVRNDLGIKKTALTKLLTKYDVIYALDKINITWNNNNFISIKA